MSILLFPVCFDFLGMLTWVTIFGNAHRASKHYSKTFNNSLHYIYSLVPCWSSFYGYIYVSYYIWKWHRPCQWHSNIVNNLYIISILIFPDFMARLVLITTFGNAHRPCWQYSNIVNNSLHNVYSFFSRYLLIFWLYLN